MHREKWRKGGRKKGRWVHVDGKRDIVLADGTSAQTSPFPSNFTSPFPSLFLVEIQRKCEWRLIHVTQRDTRWVKRRTSEKNERDVRKGKGIQKKGKRENHLFFSYAEQKIQRAEA
jgi:hypothetical protein